MPMYIAGFNFYYDSQRVVKPSGRIDLLLDSPQSVLIAIELTQKYIKF